MESAGGKLKRARERLKLTYRDVVDASRQIAEKLNNREFAIALGRLADIENKGAVPTIYRLYTLCAVYRLDFQEVLQWYGAPIDRIPAEALEIDLEQTHLLRFKPVGTAPAPAMADQPIDPDKTAFLSHLILGWGRLPLQLLSGFEHRRYHYGLIGMEDWSMYPILHPGSLVLIEERTRIAAGGWTNEHDRPIYFFERRDGYLCGWCDLAGDRLVILPHPASHRKPSIFRYPAEIDLIGQVMGVAMRLGPARRRSARTPAIPTASPDR